jgi:hypothetical protein
MAAGQFITSALTGNLGFATEALHNTSDAVSFEAKRRAMENSPRRSRNLRRSAAIILACGGLGALGGGAYQAAVGEHENAEIPAIGIAFAGAAINTYIARRTHNAHALHDDQAHCSGAHEDSKLHAVTDAATGWIYLGGLVAEHKVPGAANIAITVNGLITTSAGAMTIRNIVQTDKPPTGSAS